jgi:hypothetical protein
MSWRAFSNIRAGLADKDVATHIVVGCEKGDRYGIITYTSNEFTAYQIRRMLLKDGGSNISILPNTIESIKKIEQEIENRFFTKEIK